MCWRTYVAALFFTHEVIGDPTDVFDLKNDIPPGCTGRLPAGVLHSKSIFKNKKREFGIFIDAGSTGSRIRVFQWPERRFELEELPIQMAETGLHAGVPWLSRVQRLLREETGEESFKVEPGLSWYAHKKALNKLGPGTKGNNGLDALLDWASESLLSTGVSPERFKEIKLFLGATAGVRNLPWSEREELMTTVRNYLMGSPFETHDLQVQILTESDEGALGWVAANYFVNRIGCWDATFGVVDMGGASLQITFWAPLDLMSNSVHLVFGKDTCQERVCNRSGVPGSTVVYTVSWHNLGQDMMRRQVDALLIERQAADTGEDPLVEIVHPCVPKESSRSVEELTLEILPDEIRERSQEVTFVPAEDDHFEGCWQLHVDVLSKLDNGACKGPDCLLGKYMPNIPSEMRFFGFNSIWRMRNFLQGMMPLDRRATFADWRRNMKDTCAMSLEDLKTYNDEVLAPKKAGVSAKFLDKYCMIGTYIVALFVHSFGMDENSRRLIARSTLTDRSLEFNIGIGRMLLQVSNLPFYIEKPRGESSILASSQGDNVASILMVMCGCIAGVLVRPLWYCLRRAHHCDDIRSPLFFQDSGHQIEMSDRFPGDDLGADPSPNGASLVV
mmetsp:Transcript_54904/g.98619  ORF Transcript_54904/g.98619 Transcript_54904/m.98619 type:complete len:616 (+) Transcript_54904:86-1933(+)